MSDAPAPAGARTSLSSRLMRRLAWIALAVLTANVIFVAAFDAADRDGLMSDLISREIVNLEIAVREAPGSPPVIRDRVRSIYVEHPKAYAYAVVDPTGTVVDAMNIELMPAALLQRPVTAIEWVARLPSEVAFQAVASHVVDRPDGPYRAYFAVLDDPADLIGYEIWDEFLGHVWLPLLPTVALLIGGTLLVIRRDLAPVAAAAAWARSLRPGSPHAPFGDRDQPSEIADLTEAVNRAVERLNSELDSEKRRAAEAAHALRTPVAVLVARLDGLPDSPEYRRLKDDILALSRTVTQFLLAAGADRLEIDPEARVDLNRIAEDVVTRLSPYAALNGTEIGLAAADAPCLVQGASDAIELALTNLVENAVFHGRGTPIDVSVGPGSVLTVSDRGRGLPEDAAGRMFDPFWRGADAKQGGAGLGLAIVARIQRAHGGTLEAANRPGGGAVFTLGYPPIRP